MSSMPPLILASQSEARKKMLADVGLIFDVVPAFVDESAVQRENRTADEIAETLAEQKALAVAKNYSEALVIGADQVLEFKGQVLPKAKDKETAKVRLGELRGQTHRLISAGAVAKGETIVWQAKDEAHLTMHAFDDEFLDAYCEKAGEVLTRCVGAYALENYGSWLFSSVRGDYFTVLGLPLLPLLDYLRTQHGAKP